MGVPSFVNVAVPDGVAGPTDGAGTSLTLSSLAWNVSGPDFEAPAQAATGSESTAPTDARMIPPSFSWFPCANLSRSTGARPRRRAGWLRSEPPDLPTHQSCAGDLRHPDPISDARLTVAVLVSTRGLKE